MNITPVDSTTLVQQNTALAGNNPTGGAAKSKATKAAEQMNGAATPKAASAPAEKSYLSTNDLVKLKMLASQHVPVNQISQQLESVEAAKSTATKTAGQANGAAAPKAASAPAEKSYLNTNDLVKLKMLVRQHMPVNQIAQQLGTTVSAVMTAAAAEGIQNLTLENNLSVKV